MQEHSKIPISSERSFGLVFAAAFAVIALLPLKSGGEVRAWALMVAALFLASALVRPSLLRPLNRLWFRFGLLLGRVVAPVVMALVFLVAVTPVAVIMRARGKDVLGLKLDPSARSYWTVRSPNKPLGSLKKQY